jgi:alkanesulfonate monooxygenase SsuD/methylene tetrahydromethanopterin reductase-like flavin-dependent oxidoreductase (luciferase family)
MRFLLKLDNRFSEGKWVEKVAVEADRLGFYGFLMSDHYMWQTREPVDVTTLETWVTLSYLAGKTDQIRLGTQFSPIPFRPPGIFAKMLSTLDVLSGGRVLLGVGAGWSEAEFHGYSKWGPPRVRVDRAIEGLELMIRLWTEDEVTFNGKYYHADRAVLEPKPVQKPYPTLFVSGRARSYRMLGLAGRYGDFFNVTSRTAEGEETSESEVQKGRDYVYSVARKAGRSGKAAYAVDLRGSRYTAEVYTKIIESAIQSDAKYMITYFPRDENYLDYVKSFAREVMPSFT